MDCRRWITEKIVEFLTEPLPHYERRGWNNPHALQRHVRKGDVLLVEGDSRVAAIIKYLTQSSWSHAALYVGDELLQRGGMAERIARRFGDEADRIVVEALPEGVVASPISKYIDFNARLVRPHKLRAEDLETLIDDAVRSIGWRYDLRNVLDLARYLVPVRIVPDRFRRTALHFGSGAATEVICSSLLGQLFHRVRFPILPHVEFPDGFDAPRPARRRGILRRVFGYESARYTGIFHMRHPTLLTPRDFDLSPYFEIVKFNVISDGGFDYTRIHWAQEDLDAISARELPVGPIQDEAEDEPEAEPREGGKGEHVRPYGARSAQGAGD